MEDFHVHSNYSDGAVLSFMARAAEEAGLAGVGFTDHCNVSSREGMAAARCVSGTNLDLTHGRRRTGLDRLRERTSIDLYDAVEMDFDPRDEAAIRQFLDEVPFEYTIGSVHWVDGLNVQVTDAFAGMDDDELDSIVDTYFDTVISLIESEIFDIAAHVDVIERNPVLRDRASNRHYHRVAEAFTASRTVPEINAGRATGEPEIVHPSPPFLARLRAHDLRFTVGSDAHRPDEFGDRTAFLTSFLAEHGIDPVHPPSLR